MNEQKQKSEGWLDPALGARITCHVIEWYDENNFETIHASGDISFHRIPVKGTFRHSHDFSEVLLVSNGGLTHFVNGEKQLLRAGDIVFMRPDDIHCFMPAAEFEKVELIELDFELELFLSISVYFENDAFLQQLTQPVLPPHFHMDPAETSTMYSRMLKLNSISQAPQLRKIKLKLLIAELLSRFFIDERALLSESNVPDWLENLCAKMREEKNFTGGMEQLRKLSCRSPGHLCKSFKKYLGKTPTEYINELRINQAARLLSDSREEIVEIADRLNFQSLSAFYHLFKNMYGLSPASYRKMRNGRAGFG